MGASRWLEGLACGPARLAHVTCSRNIIIAVHFMFGGISWEALHSMLTAAASLVLN